MVAQRWHVGRSPVPAITERPYHFYGRTKVARRSQPCVKGALHRAAIFVPPLSDKKKWSGRSVVAQNQKVLFLCNTPFTQGLRPLCLPCATTKLSRSPLKAEGRQNGCLGRSRVVHRTFRHRHGRHGRREVLSMFKTVAQRSPRRSVAHRSLKGGRMKAHTSPWSQNGCTVVGHWSPS